MNYGFKVRDRNTGLFLIKGASGWNEIGKVWGKLSHLKCALNKKQIRPEWEIVTFVESGSMNLDIVMKSNFKEEDVFEAIENAK